MSVPAGAVLSGVSVRYGDVLAVDDLDLEVRAGELLAVVGPSGSGKSTVLRLLAGLEAPTAGRVRVGGREPAAVPPRRRSVAMVFQDYALFPHLTAAENIAFGLRVRRVGRAPAQAAVEAVAAQLGLAGLLDRHPDQLSGGERQRVALARAMVRDPELYLLDEPLSGLDAQLRASARQEIVELQQRLQATLVLVTHDQVEAMTMGDRVAVLAGGRLEQVGPPQEVYERPATRFVARFLGSPPMNLLPGGGPLGGREGQEVGVRPEDLSLAGQGRPGELTAGLPGRVVRLEHHGSDSVVLVDVDGHRLAVRTPSRDAPRPGELVRLVADPARLHLFDATTGRRCG